MKRQEWRILSSLIFLREMDTRFPHSQPVERQVSTTVCKQPGRGNPTDCTERQTCNVPDNEKQCRSWKPRVPPPPQKAKHMIPILMFRGINCTHCLQRTAARDSERPEMEGTSEQAPSRPVPTWLSRRFSFDSSCASEDSLCSFLKSGCWL